MKRSHWKICTAALFVVATATPTLAEVLQDPRPTVGRSEEAKQNDAAFDAQYRARRNSDDGSSAPKADPWGGVRTPVGQPAAAATTKKSTKN